LADQTPLGSSFSRPSQLSVLGLTDDQTPLGSSFRQASRHAAPLVDQTHLEESDQTPLGIDEDQAEREYNRRLEKLLFALDQLTDDIDEDVLDYTSRGGV
jgi:hypothetical protein